MLQLSRVIGHRGVAGLAPENTLNAMQKAYELGVEWVEFDVMLTKNGEIKEFFFWYNCTLVTLLCFALLVPLMDSFKGIF